MLARRPYEFMIQFTSQKEWIDRQGILFWLALFFIELGAGMFIVSSIFGSLPGMLIGWLICGVLGGGLHLLYLGKPLRFWRILTFPSGWKTSWITRGMYFLMIFMALGAIHMILAQWVTPVLGLMIAADIFAFLAVIYAGFAMAFVNGIRLWNTPMIPVLFAMAGIWGGIGLTLATVLATGAHATVLTLEAWTRLFLIGFIMILIIYLLSIRYSGDAGKFSVRQIVAGNWAPLFWVMVVVLGMAIPLVVALMGWVGGVAIPVGLIFAVILFELLGDLSLRYLILKNGYYEGLIPHTSYA